MAIKVKFLQLSIILVLVTTAPLGSQIKQGSEYAIKRCAYTSVWHSRNIRRKTSQFITSVSFSIDHRSTLYSRHYRRSGCADDELIVTHSNHSNC